MQKVLDFKPGWWLDSSSREIQPGRLIRVFLPHVDLVPHKLTVEARAEARVHESFKGVVEPLSIHAPRSSRTLPVAGMGELPGECWTLHRSKVRYALVLTGPGGDVPKALRQGAASWMTAPAVLVAPYYGGDQDGTRGGWKADFIGRIQRVEYPQYFWDRIPAGGLENSIMRLDHIQPVGLHTYSYELTDYELAPDALGFIMEQVEWLASGLPEPTGEALSIVRELLASS